jgi:hypothetical protein
VNYDPLKHVTTSKLPPAFVVGAHYDAFLQRALSRFFDRATLETESLPSPSSDGRLAIESTEDPSALHVRWFGNRYVLRVPADRPFTSHEVEFAKAIGAVLESRFRAILNPELLMERQGLFRGAIEDRYVGAFFDGTPYSKRADGARSERVAEVLEILRVAALSTYENHPISTGVVLLEGDEDPVAHYPAAERDWPHYTGALTSIKSFFRLADGVRTVFLVARDGRLLDIVDINRWAGQLNCRTDLVAPCARTYMAHACATIGSRNVCIVLSPGREIKVFADGAQMFTFRNADWHLLDLQAKYRMWERAVGQPALARKLFQTTLDLADVREGALFVVLRRPMEHIAELVAPGDRLDMELVGEQSDPETPSRRHLLHVLAGRTITDLDPSLLDALATLDGAVVTDREGQLLAVGAILRHPPATLPGTEKGYTEGARTTAAIAASRYGPVLKVSEDGMITFFDDGRVWDI